MLTRFQVLSKAGVAPLSPDDTLDELWCSEINVGQRVQEYECVRVVVTIIPSDPMFHCFLKPL
jgi:hypothetical protein